MENRNSYALFFKDYYNHYNKNPKAKYLNYSVTRSSSNYRRIKREKGEKERSFREKVELKTRKLFKDKKKKGDSGDDDDDEYYYNDQRVYRDDEGKIIPALNNREGSINTVNKRMFNLNNFWDRNEEVSKKEQQQEQVEENPHRKEAGKTLNKYYDNIESVVNKEKIHPGLIERYDNAALEPIGNLFDESDNDEFEEDRWARFAGGYFDPNYTKSKTGIELKGLDTPINSDFISCLKTGQCYVIEANDLSIHVDSRNIMIQENDTRESIYNFFSLLMNDNNFDNLRNNV